MSLTAAKRALQWKIVEEALESAQVDTETRALVEHAKSAEEMFQSIAITLLRAADVTQPKNCVKFEMAGLVFPFDRACIELVRSGGKTSHELREMLRDKLQQARHYVDGSHGRGMPTPATFLTEIDALLEQEAP